MAATLKAIVDVRSDGDVVLVVNGLAGVAQTFGLRVSSHALRFSSPVFDNLLATSQSTALPSGSKQAAFLSLPDEDGDTLFLLCTVLHLRNSALPHRLTPEQLHKFALAAAKYQCTVAVGRATTVWFDYVYTGMSHPPLIAMIEAAYILDEPIFFARFASRWVLSSVFTSDSVWTPQEPGPINTTSDEPSAALKLLIPRLLSRRAECHVLLRGDIDNLVDPCATSLDPEVRHVVDTPPDDGTDDIYRSEDREECVVDKAGAYTYLGALRSEGLWPATRWPNTLRDVVDGVADFAIPYYDDSDNCRFCDGVVGRFSTALDLVRGRHRARLWGLCLDCVRKGPGGSKVGGCRVEHGKAKMTSWTVSMGLPQDGGDGDGGRALQLTIGSMMVTPITPTAPLGALNI